MSNEFKPKHTFLFWVMMGLFAYAFISLAIATATLDKCGRNGKKEWGLIPPGWVCAPTR